ncbi:hypothetical protein [Aurantimonas sp. VKM B-3413]|uniref:hypothetical protein n=1 Tax=Aurantimonas sp. VKM B-3413 TaxID=2779401 RepID=UPI001E42DBC9|nr:hypothetical protein [Aurantimonas sp. VKM B-3413]MCB8837853.1 hypothetical protein [Aurantimonas sp. VKM B-3413]
MFAPKLIRSLAFVAVLLPVGACQSIFPDSEDPSLALLQAAPTPPGGSGQRLDENGYPLLGATPRAATTQLRDDEVKAEQARLSAAAANLGQSTAGMNSSSYDAEIRRLQNVRKDQAAELDKALAARPKPAEPAKKKAPVTSPEEVLRQIEAGQ